MKKANFARIIIGTAIVLSVPLIAMAFTDEVDWNGFDFAVIGTLLISAGVLFEVTASKIDSKYRAAVAVIVAAAVLLIWAELAVGVFGSPFAGS